MTSVTTGNWFAKTDSKLHLKGKHSTQHTTVRRGLFTPIDHRRFLVATNRFGKIPFALSDLDLAAPAEYVGMIPAEFTAVQDLPQWSPQLNRIFRIGPSEEVPSFDWSTIRPETLSKPGSCRIDFSHRFTPASAIAAGRCCCTGNGRRIGSGNPESTCSHRPPSGTILDIAIEIATSTEARPNRNPKPPRRISCRTSCLRPAVGIFTTVAQVGPHGGNNFEDLVMLDPTDPGQWLLVIAQTKGDDLLLYRHLYLDRPFDDIDPFPVTWAVPRAPLPTPSTSPRR